MSVSKCNFFFAELKPMSEAPTDSTVQADEATETNTEEAVDLVVQGSAATGTKCVRCWHIRDDIGTDSAHPELCARCVTNVSGDGEVRHYA